MNPSFVEKSKNVVPSANIFNGHYINKKFDKKFDLIISFGVLMYFEPSIIDFFFKKTASDLNENGNIFIQYSHATRFLDLLYPDLSYVRYSPRKIEKIAKKYFTVLEHKHFFYEKKVNSYDKNPYYFPVEGSRRLDTLENTYLIIARKK